jgi:Tfp pilus assembly protein PilF
MCFGTVTTAGCATAPERNPEQAQIQYQLAWGYYQNRRVEAALEELSKALKADPENAEVYNLLGIIALNQGHDYTMQAETVSCLKGKDGEAVRADALRRFRQAEESFRKAVTFNPEHSAAWNNLAVAALQQRDWERAITAAGNALKNVTYKEPEMARANLGWAHYQKKDLQHAWKELHEAVSRAPGFCVGRYRLAKVHVDRGETDIAAEQVDAVIQDKRCPRFQEAYLLAGLVHERRKDREGAKALFDQCVQLAPRSCLAEECTRYAQLIQ